MSNAINLALARRLWHKLNKNQEGSYPNRESTRRHAYGKVFNGRSQTMKVRELTREAEKEASLARRANNNAGVGPKIRHFQRIRDNNTGKKYLVVIRDKYEPSKNLRSAINNGTINFKRVEAALEALARAKINYKPLRPNAFQVYRNHRGDIKIIVNNYGSSNNKQGGFFRRGNTPSVNTRALNNLARLLGVRNRHANRQSNTPSAAGNIFRQTPKRRYY